MNEVDLALFNDLLTVGTVGLIVGVAFPFLFRLIGYVVDAVRLVVE